MRHEVLPGHLHYENTCICIGTQLVTEPSLPYKKYAYVCGLGNSRSPNRVSHCEPQSVCRGTAAFLDTGVKIHAHVIFSMILRKI